MSFQAYIDNIKKHTGKSPEDFLKLAEKKGFLKPDVKTGEIVAWLKKDFGLGHGHAMAIMVILNQVRLPKESSNEKTGNHFKGKRAAWKDTYDTLLEHIKQFGDGISASPTSTYISLLHSGKKFAIVQITSDRIDIGIKRKGKKPTARFTPSGDWNTMVTHRVQITNPKQIDAELFTWLKEAYENTK